MTNDLEKNNHKQEDEISLKELILKIKEWWQYLWSKKWIIIAAGIVGGLLGLGYSFTKKPIYTATTRFVLEGGEKGGGLGAYAGVASMMGIDLGGGGGDIFQGDNILELYKSRTMLRRTLNSRIYLGDGSETLMSYYTRMNNWNLNLPDAVFTIPSDSVKLIDTKYGISLRYRDSLIGKAIDDISRNYLFTSRPEKKLSIIKIDVRSADELFAKKFNDNLVKNVNDFYIQTKTKKSIENVEILQLKTDSVKRVMNGAIYSAVSVADATPNLNPTRQSQRLVPAQKAQVSVETNKAILSSLIQNLELAKMSLLKETPLIQVVDEPVFPLIKTKFSKSKGIIIGGLFFGFLALIFLVIKKVIKDATSQVVLMRTIT